MTDQTLLPPDFVASTYCFLNPDLAKCNTEQAERHYLSYGKKEGRIYKYDLPEDFKSETYIKLNRDLSHLNEQEACIHYVTHGKAEGRIYSTKVIPKDFTPEKYRLMYYDLKDLSDVDCIRHYMYHRRKYLNAACYNKYQHYCNTNHKNLELIRKNIEQGVPFNFSPAYYMKNFEVLPDAEQKKINPREHYLTHGYHEQRMVESTEVERQGSCIFFVAHESEITGAPIYLANLVNYYAKNNIFSNMCFLLPFGYNNQFYRNLLPEQVTIMHYYNDLHVFLHLVARFDPIFIHFNSIFAHFDNPIMKEIADRCVFHFHEDIFKLSRAYREGIINLIHGRPVYSIQRRMQISLRTHNVESIINPNFLSVATVKMLKHFYKQAKPLIKKDRRRRGNLKMQTIGMVGSLCLRKGTDIFMNVAKAYPMHNFVWIGGSVDELKSSDFPKLPMNVTHYPNMSHQEVIKHVSSWDWFFLSSRQDYNPYVVLEALFLGVPVIYLEGNVWQEYPDLKGIYSIAQHRDQPERIIPKFNTIIQNKITCQDKRVLHNYVSENFTKPLMPELNNADQYVILSMWINLDDAELIAYYKNLIQHIRMINDGNVKVIAVAKIITEEHGNRKFRQVNLNTYTFDIAQNPDEYSMRYQDLCADTLIFMPNRGYDIGGLMVGLRYMREHRHRPTYLMYLHSKSNYAWRRDLHSIVNVNLSNLPKHNTVVPGKWVCEYNLANDSLNNQIFQHYKDLLPLNGVEKFQFVGGTMFNTRYEYLESLNINALYEELTHIKKNDVFWVSAMKNKAVFNKYYEIYRKNPFNAPMTPDSAKVMVEEGLTNAYQVFKHGEKGIPDLQLEHVIERYLGYLVCYNRQLYYAYK